MTLNSVASDTNNSIFFIITGCNLPTHWSPLGTKSGSHSQTLVLVLQVPLLSSIQWTFSVHSERKVRNMKSQTASVIWPWIIAYSWPSSLIRSLLPGWAPPGWAPQAWPPRAGPHRTGLGPRAGPLGWASRLNPGPAKNYLMTFLKIILLIILRSTGITWSVELKLSTLKNGKWGFSKCLVW